jgi:hypothetical protein
MGGLEMKNWHGSEEGGVVGRRRFRGCLVERVKVRAGGDVFGGGVHGSAGRKSGRACLVC